MTSSAEFAGPVSSMTSTATVPTTLAAAADGSNAWNEKTLLDYDALNTAEPQYASNAAVYTFKGEEGIVGEPDEEIEKQLFANKTRAGDAMKALDLDVTVESATKIKPIRSFEGSGVHPVVLENINKCGYDTPTAIQAYCIPAVLQDLDIVAVAQTGSGKTAAYMVPIISKLMGKVDKIGGPRVDTRRDDYNPETHKVRAEPLVVIVCPTRELAQQIFDEARRLSYRSKLRPVCAYGGVPLRYNIQQLSKGCDILIGTPGRLCDLMDRLHLLTMSRVKYTIIDEADEMLSDNWDDEVGKIMAGGDTNEDADHLYMMFSATFPKSARALARQYMQQEYARIRVGRAGSSHKNVRQNIVWVDGDAKNQAVFDLLSDMAPGLTIIFRNTIHGVEELDDFLFNKGLPTTFMHSRRTQYEREDAMRSFRLGKSPILIATGVSARGIDFTNVVHVINYDMPSMAQSGIEEYVHRIGRTGRIGHQGLATSFYNERDEEIGQPLVNLLMETDQEIPDFLSQFKPEEGVKVEFHDDTDDEDEDTSGGAAFGFGSTTDNGAAAFGADSAAGDANGFGGATETADAWGTTTTDAPSVAAW